MAAPADRRGLLVCLLMWLLVGALMDMVSLPERSVLIEHRPPSWPSSGLEPAQRGEPTNFLLCPDIAEEATWRKASTPDGVPGFSCAGLDADTRRATDRHEGDVQDKDDFVELVRRPVAHHRS